MHQKSQSALVAGCEEVPKSIPAEVEYNGADSILEGIEMGGKSLKLMDGEELIYKGRRTVFEA